MEKVDRNFLVLSAVYGLLGMGIGLGDLPLCEHESALDAVSALKPEYPGWMLARQAEGRVPGPKA